MFLGPKVSKEINELTFLEPEEVELAKDETLAVQVSPKKGLEESKKIYIFLV